MPDTAQTFRLPALRDEAKAIFLAGIDAADPYAAVKRCLAAGAHSLEIALNIDAGGQKRCGRWMKIHAAAFGKAACAMAKAVQECIPAQHMPENGIAVTNYENVTTVDNFEVIGAGHPLPDAAGFAAARKIAVLAERAQQGELLLVLVSGGGSALLPYPIAPVTLDDKIAVTQALLACGATINQINCVRKHLSQLKGGGLARKVLPADSHALILSDVLGDDLSAIASGPTVPDETTFADAIAVLRARNLWNTVPKTVRSVLEAGLRGDIAETPKNGDPAFVRSGYTLIGSNAISVRAIAAAAEQHGYQSLVYSDRLCGEARDAAEKLAATVKCILNQDASKPLALLAGGETTVTLRGNGRGGRNQEMALAFALAAERLGLPPCWSFLSGGTDGRDGPTDAAGGNVDAYSLQRMRAAGIDPQALLDNNDSYAALFSSHDLLITGATGTNVADLQIVLIHPF
ncbi:MAG: glycerate kinase type-2 family protein [Gammaproteobacteria bacterium]